VILSPLLITTLRRAGLKTDVQSLRWCNNFFVSQRGAGAPPGRIFW
jgi:hypothetical protein